MYHQFADKAALFRDVVEVVEQDVMARMATLVAARGGDAGRCNPGSGRCLARGIW